MGGRHPQALKSGITKNSCGNGGRNPKSLQVQNTSYAGGGTPPPVVPGPFSSLVPGTILYQVSTGYVGTVIEQVADPNPTSGDWGWLTIRFDGRAADECKLPIVTTTNLDILSTNPSGWTSSDLGIKVQEVSGPLENYRGCSCAPCANIPNQTGQGLPVC